MLKLIVKWKQFCNQINNFLLQADELLYLHETCNKNIDYEAVNSQINDWFGRCYTYLQKSFNNVNNEFAHGFYSAKPYVSYIITGNKEGKQKITDVFEELETKRKKLNSILNILSVCDAIIQPDFVDLKLRGEYSQIEIIELILDKLYHLSDNNYYPVQVLLRGNGIKTDNNEELIKMIKSVENQGLVRAIYSGVINVKLSLKGKSYIYEKRRFEFITPELLRDETINMEEIFQELGEQINKTNLGSEMLYKELKDLKSLYSTLGRKSWVNLVRGKLFDLEAARIINKETVRKIYQTMIDEKVRFVYKD